MTIKELAQKYQRNITEIYRILAQKGVKGLHKNEQLPKEVEVVVVSELENTPINNLALKSSQSTAEPEEKEAIQPSPNGQHIEMKTRLQNASQAMATQSEHQYTETLNQGINNAVTMGALKAASENLAFANAYTETSKALYELGINQQKELAQTLVEKLSDPDFLLGKTPAENYFHSSQITANNQLATDWMNIIP